MMNDFAKRWVQALRSGEYKQCIRRLRRRDSFCVFGVACDLMHDSFKDIKRHALFYSYDGCSSVAPTIVIDALELKTTTGMFKTPDSILSSLVTLNDNGVPFTEIADYIEQYQDQLFEN